MNHVVFDAAEGVPKLKFREDEFKNCEVCIRAKSSCLPRNTDRHSVVRVCEIVCSDILGPMAVSSLNQGRYVVNFVDDYSNFLVSYYVIHDRTEVYPSIVDYIKKGEAMFRGNFRIRTFRCDGAKEYVMGKVKKFCEERGITYDVCTPHTPQLNGKAERINKTLMEKYARF